MRRLAVILLVPILFCLLLILCLGAPLTQVQGQAETETPTITPTATDTPTPTPESKIFIPLSSGNYMIIDRYMTFGEIAFSIFLLVLTLVTFLFGLIKLLRK
jgi:hypothetical protein